MSEQYPKNKKLHGWSLELSEFDFEIIHIPSKLNSISGCLSRIISTVIVVWHKRRIKITAEK